MPKVVLGFDFGMKYIGVAVGQSLTGQARPLPTLKAVNGEPNWQTIEKLIKTWRVDELVVGIPLNIDGTEQAITIAAKKFSDKLATAFQLPVHGVDERLSTVAAREQVFETGGFKKLKQTEIDSIAAKLIVEQWFSSGS